MSTYWAREIQRLRVELLAQGVPLRYRGKELQGMPSAFRRPISLDPFEYRDFCDYAKAEGRSFANFANHSMRYYIRMHKGRGQPVKGSSEKKVSRTV